MRAKILVVDDEWPVQELLRHTLSLSGFDVLIAANEVEFRNQALTQSPHIIILDIMLGEKDGVKIYEQLLTEGLNPEIPVVFLSALAQDRPPTPPKPQRRYALIGKPFDPEELVHQLHDWFSA